MNTPIGDKLFQDIPRRVAKFRENRPKDVENLVDGKKITRMLAINVSIPNLTVARLEQLPLRMLILENLISRFENKNSRDLVENSSRRRIGVG